MCLSSRPGLIKALSKTSARLVEASTMTWSVVPIPVGKQANPKVTVVPSTDSALPAYRGAGQDAEHILESFSTKPEGVFCILWGS